MIKNSRVFTENGVSEEVEYTIIDRVNGNVVAKDWTKNSGVEAERTPTADEIAALEEQEAGLTVIRNVQVPEAAIEDLQNHLADPGLTDIEEVKVVIKEFIDSII